MWEGNDYTSEMLRLHTEAAQARLQAIESQLALGATLCSLAETEIVYSRIAEARRIIEKVQHSVESIRYHLDEPNHSTGSRFDAAQSPFDLCQLVAQFSR